MSLNSEWDTAADLTTALGFKFHVSAHVWLEIHPFCTQSFGTCLMLCFVVNKSKWNGMGGMYSNAQLCCIFFSVARKWLWAIDYSWNYWTQETAGFFGLRYKKLWEKSSETSTTPEKIFVAPGAHHWSCADSKAGASSEDANHKWINSSLSDRTPDLWIHGSSPHSYII